ncbi:MAG TPA: hypothetical protein VHH36_04100, partial [Candidatus Thermoplasmatota archaeon]|nr:hypothetical protein [Candidatus Thermoplasmatota archaeon]
MLLRLAPGERLLPGAEAAARAILEDPRVEAVLLRLDPEGDGAFARAARRQMRAWDGRLVHRQTCWAPGARVAVREGGAGWRAAGSAPLLADALERGRLVEAVPGPAVATPLGRDLETWRAAWRNEGRAWGALAARDARFRPFLPA